jgi:hypothetical protein
MFFEKKKKKQLYGTIPFFPPNILGAPALRISISAHHSKGPIHSKPEQQATGYFAVYVCVFLQ